MKRRIITGFAMFLLMAASVVTLSGCADQAAGGDIVPLLIFLVLMMAMFYFLIIMPQRKRQKQQQQMISELKTGDRVVTIGGIHGVVDRIEEDAIVIKVESGATIRMTKSAVGLKMNS